jgi:IS30 family transposase
MAKLVEEDIPNIRQLMVEGLSNQDIAERYCVAKGTISKIRDGKTWKHVPCEVDVPKTSAEFKKKLSADDIPTIRDLYSKGVSLAEIGRIFSVHSGSISGIISGKSWKNY